MSHAPDNIRRVIFAVAAAAVVEVGDICGKRRWKPLPSTRAAITFLCRHAFPLEYSYPDIAAAARPGHGHTGILFAYRRFLQDTEAQRIALQAATALGVHERYLREVYRLDVAAKATAAAQLPVA